MNNDELIQQKILETRRYEFSDGLRDIQIGIYVFFLGVIDWLIFEPAWWRLLFNIRETTGKVTMMLASLLVFFVPVLIAFVFLRLMEAVRRKWLWRESGMVKTARWVVPKKVSVISAVIMIVGLGIGLLLKNVLTVDEFFVWRLLFSVAGISFAYTLVAMGANLHLNRYYSVGILGGLASAISLWLPLSPGLSCLVLFGFWGLLLGISGVVVLVRSMCTLKGSEHAG